MNTHTMIGFCGVNASTLGTCTDEHTVGPESLRKNDSTVDVVSRVT